MAVSAARTAYMREYMRLRRQDSEFVAAEKARRSPEVARASTRRYLQNHPGHVQRWRADNPERARAQTQQRRARVRNADHGCVTSEFLQEVYGMACAYCGSPCEHVDHAFPIARGGMHCVENIQPSCAHCNTTKGDRILEILPTAIATCEVNRG